MPNEPIILASGSPRRRALLEEAGVSFDFTAAEVKELDGESAPNLASTELALSNALMKANAVAQENPGRWVLGADTVVALEGRIFGKPSSPDEAREFLRALAGQTHEVVTACVLRKPEGGSESFHESSRVTFLPLPEKLITRYLAAVDVMDKAGAYALQEKSELIVATVEGSRSNVIGLPMEKLMVLLRRHQLAT